MALRLVHDHRNRRFNHPGRILKDQMNPLDRSDDYLRERCRFDRAGLMYLCELLQEELERPTAYGLPAILQVYIAVRYLATGSHQIIDGDAAQNVSKASSVCSCSLRFT